jgi:microfibrillar-associated protein 1
MPPPSKRMTANPARPARYRAGKPTQEESSEDDSSDSDQEEDQPKPTAPAPKPAPPASSFPKSAAHITTNLQNVDLNARRQAAAAEAARKQAAQINEDDFETEESEDGSGFDGSDSEEEEESAEEEEESSSEEDVAARRKLLRPVFIKKGARKDVAAAKPDEEKWAEEEAKRLARANELVQAQLEKNAAAKAAGKKFWDDEDNIVDEVDDTDDLDPEAELTAWKLRELTRVKRDRDAIETKEKQLEEQERLRNLSKEERDAEDKARLDEQQKEKDSKGTMGFMQKYYHKGAYFTEDLQQAGLDKRDIMGGRYQDDVSNRDALPEYMQIRDMTKLGKKGRTRYKDLKSEDTGRWGEFGQRGGGGRGGHGDGGGGGFDGDERFRPDWDRAGGGGGGEGPSGANASALGERKRHADELRGGEKRVRVD